MTEEHTLVDINRATLEELVSIKGIGQNLASRIVEHRPYKALHDLVNIPGINETKLAALMPYLALTPASITRKTPKKSSGVTKAPEKQPIATLGETEAFVFLEDRNERQDALLILFGGFILGLIILLLRRAGK